MNMTTVKQASGAIPEAAKTSPHRLALLLLVLAYTLSIADRMILSILFPNIKAEFGLSDAQLGLLGGFSFALFYATLGIPIARLADRYSRKMIIVVSLAIFSLMTALSGWAAGLISLFVFRIGVGIGEAGVNPASHSMIADYFPAHRRAFAMAILMLGANVGMILGFAAGGVIAEHYGWRIALMSVGFPGLLLAFVFVWLLREPPRGSFEDYAKSIKPTERTNPVEQSSPSPATSRFRSHWYACQWPNAMVAYVLYAQP
jgi:MFS family permease